jgi:hypothetical protein
VGSRDDTLDREVLCVVAAGLGLESVCESCARTKKGDDRTVDASSVHKLVVTFFLKHQGGGTFFIQPYSQVHKVSCSSYFSP